MWGISAREIVGVLTACALAVSLPLGRKLSRWSHHRLRATESFAAGASLAYVIVDLMVELTAIGGTYVHSRIPIGPTPLKSLFAVVLAGATWWYLVAALAAKVQRPRARYRAYVFPQMVYSVFVGGALALEAESGGSLILFALPILLHFTVVESHINHAFESQHSGFPRTLLAVGPALGAMAWTFLRLPRTTLFMAQDLVPGSTVVQVIQTELPSPDQVRVGPFLLGVAIYVSMIAARWASGGGGH